MSEKKPSEEFIWNFAFGSNMSSKVLDGRRNLQPLEKVAGYVKDYRLDYFSAMPYSEPGMGTIEPAVGEECHGLLIKLTPERFQMLYATEGGPNGNYALLELNCIAYDGRSIKAFAFQAKQGYSQEYECLPSKRYLDIIKEGAKECNLKPSYLEKLEKEYRHYEPNPTMQWIFWLLHLPLYALIALLMFVNNMLRKFNAPFTVSFIIGPIFYYMTLITWTMHDHLWIHVLGNGGKYKRKIKK
jgi:hypothetical protein